MAWITDHYDDLMMGAMASQITSLTIGYSTVYSDADQRKHQSSASPAFVRGIQRGPVNSPPKWPVTRKMFPFHDVIKRTFVSLNLDELTYWNGHPYLTTIESLYHDMIDNVIGVSQTKFYHK